MLPELIAVDEIRKRLESIFPEGTADRGFLTRELSAKVVYTMIYAGAVDGEQIWIGPKQVYRMSDEQALLVSDDTRRSYGLDGWKAQYKHTGKPWYADTSREPIRDETLRALVRTGAVIELDGIPTTSSKPRYTLASDFVELFSPQLKAEALAAAIRQWQKAHLSAHALARLQLVREGLAAGKAYVEVTLPRRGTRQLAPGPSAVITKAVIEEFAPRFLYAPTVLLLSESRKKIIEIDHQATKAVGLNITPSLVLPDVVLFDAVAGQELLVFVEVVATDGPITDERRAALAGLVPTFSLDRVAFVSAFADRGAATFRKSVSSLAWNTVVWFASEPDHAMILRESTALEERRVFDLLGDED